MFKSNHLLIWDRVGHVSCFDEDGHTTKFGHLDMRMQKRIFFWIKHLVYEEPEIGFLILEKLVVGVGVNFMGSIIEVQAVIQILFISLRNHNQMLHYKIVRPPGV